MQRQFADRVAVKLRHPVVAISFWNVPVLGAAMPEAAVNEHSYAPPDKDNIRPHSDFLEPKRMINPKAQAAGM